jgi:NAD(P)-dependent dehydrogenase (short-subunit alcohol dehydrogenase family)
MDVPSMKGKTVVVTGANSGIGFETAAGLAGAGARTLLTARDAQRGRAAVQAIIERTGNQEVELVALDLASLVSVRAAAADVLERCPHLDVLVNNAGLVLTARRETTDGFEMTFGVNLLGPFLFTELLVERLKASAPSRIVNVASTAHTSARRGLNFDDLQNTSSYSGMRVYGESKLANIMFTAELARRLEGTGVTANSLHPGTVATGYGRDGDTKGLLAIGLTLAKPFLTTPEKGARTSIYLASSPEVEGVSGKYFVNCREKTPRKPALDVATQQRLWEVSESLVGATTAGS